MLAAAHDRPAYWTSDEWSTPARLVREIAALYGPFDLDPCCRPETAKAPRFFTRDVDGLAHEWHGRVFLNPPYSKPAPWLEKSIEETQAGRAEIVVALLPVSTSTSWFHHLVLGCAELHFLRGRVRFIGWRGTPIGNPKTASVVAVYRCGKLGATP